jgi:hypothetical protein
MRCQTSPDWSQMRWNDPDKRLKVEMAGEGGFLYWLSSSMLFWETDLQSCEAVNMGGEKPIGDEFNGSLGRLWPLFVSLCFSQFIETLACALQGRPPLPETGMTIFELSLGFADAETSSIRPFEVAVSTKNGTTGGAPRTPDPDEKYVTRAEIFKLINASPEVLLISLISSLSHLSSNILAVLGLRDKLRLINTSISGAAYMAAFVWSATTIREGPESALLRFPILCMVWFVPHLMMVVGLSACAVIYGLALVLTAMSPPPTDDEEPKTFRERFAMAHRNLQANIHLSSSSPITLSWRDDFYTSLMKAGFTILTAASEAVYLNEASRVNMAESTWLEEKRLDELAAQQRAKKRTLDLIPPEIRNDLIHGGSVNWTDTEPELSASGAPMRSGYARERKTKTVKSPRDRAFGDTGEFSQRRGKLAMLIDFGKGISWVTLGLFARANLALLQRFGIRYRPRWLTALAGQPRRLFSKSPPTSSTPRERRMLEFWMLSDEGSLQLATDDQVDVEAETRRRLHAGGELEDDSISEEGDSALGSYLYQWWKHGGWWGEVDTSGDYAPSVAGDDDDTTSVISFATTQSGVEDDGHPDWVDEDSFDESGRRTPTQSDPHPSRSRLARSPSPDDSTDMARLARLLDPTTPAEREEAVMLSRHLTSPGPVTRSQYRRSLTAAQSRIFANSFKATNPEDEERALEAFILERRGLTQPASRHLSPSGNSNPATGRGWRDGGEGMGSGGPQCVVCHSAPRTILMWPCGCLSLCDECRVGLATRNFNTCVCCRTDVGAYSRLYVP